MFETITPALWHYGPQKAITLEDVVWREPDGSVRVTKRGFPTDGASLPWVVQWRWKPFDPRYLRSAIIHDEDYALMRSGRRDMSRLSCDRKFGERMRAEGFHDWRKFSRACMSASWMTLLPWRKNAPEIAYWISIRDNDAQIDRWIEQIRNTWIC